MSMTFTVQVPDELGVKIQRAAKKHQVSINQYFLSTLNERLCYQDAQEKSEEHLKDASKNSIEEILAAIPDRPPLPGDELQEVRLLCQQ